MSDKMTDKSTDKKGFSALKVVHKAVCIALVTAAALISVCLVTNGAGALGGGIRALLRGLFSWGSVLIPIALVAQAIGYAEDLETKGFGKRCIFALASTVLISCIEYAIFTWGADPVFSPADSFLNMNCGGFIGNVIGFALSSLIGQLGLIIVAVAVLAIYSIFFFAEKAGSIGKAALNFAAGVKSVFSFIKDKLKARKEKKRQLKEDAALHEREVTSEELSDDEFFRAKGDASEVKIKKLGIEENASTHGLSPLSDPEKRIPEEPVVTEEPEEKRKKADKPLDLSYGITEEVAEESVAEPEETKPERIAIGLDDSADSVFTRDFDPFDFATSEKTAAKYASRVSSSPAVTEELDEMTIYRMKADHEPDERERRLMELERRKQEWMRRKGGATASEPSSAPSAAPVAATTPVVTESTTPSVASTAPAVDTAAPVHSEPAVATPHTEPTYTPSTAAAGTSSGYRTPSAPASPIKTVEFTVSKTPSASVSTGTPTAKPSEKPVSTDENVEDAAILIAERVARNNPTYARSANDLKTYTTVVSDGDDELYRMLEGIDAEPASVPVTDSVSSTATAITSSYATPVAEAVPVSSSVEEIVIAEAAHTIPAETSTDGMTGSIDDEPATEAVPEIKPYTSPAESIQPSVEEVASEESTLKVDRSMLPPTVSEAAAPKIDNTGEVTEKAEAPIAEPVSNVNVTSDGSSTEIDFIPVDEESHPQTAASEPVSSVSVAEPLFNEVDSEDESDDGDVEVEVSSAPIAFDEDDEDDESDEDDGDEEYEMPEDEVSEDVEGEIPPEEQNPDVIKMRGMFNCLDPIDSQPTSMPQTDGVAEITIPAEEIAEEPPFDGGVEVKPLTEEAAESVEAEPAKTVTTAAVVPVSEAKSEKKKNKPDYSDYQFPPLDFLAKENEGHDENIQAEIQENADKLIETLASFGVTASIKGVDRGPRITRYEVVPAKGVKVSSILGLQDDIALNLAAGSIRMEAPIPGKSAVGIEIPNKSSSIVRLRDLIETPDFQSARSKTQVCIGRDVAGQPVFGDLAKMPHLLIAGATGMGKSVCINSLLISILYKARPDEVKLIMIDPKQVEFTMYNGIPHLLVPVVSDSKQAAGALMWAVEEMERRYNLLNSVCSKSVDSYNEKVTSDPSLGEPLPKIIIVIDEFADLMLQVKDPVEQLVTRIAQKARAAGIHLVIGTQRPSVNVITGVIKANVPSRISCKVMSNVDSKTVLDSAGAEKLLDKGDALYAPAGSPKPHRLQCAYVDESEVEVIMNYLKAKTDGESYDSTVMEDIERAAQKCSKKGDRDEVDRDESSGEGYLNDRQFLDAVEIAVNTRKISTSLIQRKMSIGYGKAAKFIDVMEDMGIVGPANGQRPRDVLISPDEWREKLSRTMID